MQRNFAAHSEKATITETVDHRVKLYSVVAAAAGVSMLALAQPVEAEVVVTKAHLPIVGAVLVDLNKDGIVDFQLSMSAYNDFTFISGNLRIRPRAGGAVVGSRSTHGGYASALIRGTKIGQSANFDSDSNVTIERSQGFGYGETNYTRQIYGKWGGNPRNRFLGLKFVIHGATHYGWVRLTVNTTKWPLSATITGYAYETIANKRILAGIPPSPAVDTKTQQPSEGTDRVSLGMLALGADGLALWRRDETLPS